MNEPKKTEEEEVAVSDWPVHPFAKYTLAFF